MGTEGFITGRAEYEIIFRQYYQSLCFYANTWLKDMDAAEEVVQNTFVKLWEKRESLKPEVSLKAYLYKAVYNASLNEIKHQKVKDKYINMQNQEEPTDHIRQEQSLKDLERRIKESLERLPEQCRLVFQLSRFENLKYREIAEVLNISVKTVENHMGKALRLMRQNLADYLVVTIIIIHHIIHRSW